MIPESYITEWSEQAPWVVNKFIEQEMILGPQVEYDPQVAWEKVKEELVELFNTEFKY